MGPFAVVLSTAAWRSICRGWGRACALHAGERDRRPRRVDFQFAFACSRYGLGVYARRWVGRKGCAARDLRVRERGDAPRRRRLYRCHWMEAALAHCRSRVPFAAMALSPRTSVLMLLPNMRLKLSGLLLRESA